MAIEFFDNDNRVGNASIYEAHITVNKNLANFLVDAYKARIGVDKDTRKIYIFIVTKEYAQSGEIAETSLLPISISKSYARVCSRAMIEYVTNVFALQIPEKGYLRFKGVFDEVKKAIIINLEEKV